MFGSDTPVGVDRPFDPTQLRRALADTIAHLVADPGLPFHERRIGRVVPQKQPGVYAFNYSVERIPQFFEGVAQRVPAELAARVRDALSGSTTGPKSFDSFFARAPEEAVRETVIVPFFRAYTIRAGAIRWDDAAFAQTFDAALGELSAGTTTFLITRPLLNLTVDQIIDVGPFRLRPNTPADLDDWQRRNVVGTDELAILSSAPCIAERAITVPLPGWNQPSLHLSASGDDALDTALQLATGADAVSAFTDLSHPGELGRGGQHRRPPPGPVPTLYTASLTPENAATVTDLMKALASLTPNDLLGLALRRWKKAVTSTNPEDALLDHWTALESIFLSDSRQEIQFRASLRIAGFIGQDGAERVDLYKAAQASYGYRSAIAHGERDAKKLKDSLKKFDAPTLAKLTRDMLRRSLVKLLLLEDRSAFQPQNIELTLLSTAP